jgi:hypothetical protein
MYGLWPRAGNLRRSMSKCLLAAALFFVAILAGAQTTVFQTAAARLTIEPSGIVSGLIDKRSGNQELRPTGQPIATVSVGGREIPANSFHCSGAHCRVTFGDSGISADYKVSTTSDYILFEVAGVEGGHFDKLTFLQLSTALPTTGGQILAVRWDDSFAIGLISLAQDVETAIVGPRLCAKVYPDLGVPGRRAVLIAQPPARFLTVMEQVEKDFSTSVPHPTIDGVWAKSSPAASTNYLFTNLTESNADEVLRYARAGQIPYILILAHTWTTSFGSYPVNTINYPHGEAGLKAVVDKFHSAGIRVGLHMLAGEVSKTDAWVRPVPNPGLLKAGQTTLAEAISSSQAEFSAPGPLTGTPVPAADIQIDNEILHCARIEGGSFSQCRRGYSGTISAPHRAGAPVQHLAEADSAYLADLRSPLFDRINSHIANLLNTIGFDMVDIDGGELNAIGGPFWYLVGLQQYDIWKQVRHDLLVQGSGITPWSWHFFTRGISDDFATVGVKQNFQLEKVGFAWKLNHDAFLPADLGWVGLLDATPDHPATMPDEMELFAARALALNSGLGVESSNAELEGNGRSAEMLGILAAWQKLRNSPAVTPEIRTRLASGEWHLTPDGKLHPVIYDRQRIALSSGSGSFTTHSTFAAQPLHFRLRADPAVGPADNTATPLFESSFSAPPPNPGDKMPGALIRQIPFARPVSLLNSRALGVRVTVEGPPAAAHPAVLNVQLRDTSGNLRDYYLDLSFHGSKTVVIPTQGADRILADFWPVWANYPFKSAIRSFNYSSVQSLVLRWMRYPAGSGVRCTVQEIMALAEQPAELGDVEISSGSASFRVPGVLRTGDYAEYWGGGGIRVYDVNNVLLRTVPPASDLSVQPGESSLHIRASGAGTLDLTVISLGPAVN